MGLLIALQRCRAGSGGGIIFGFIWGRALRLCGAAQASYAKRANDDELVRMGERAEAKKESRRHAVLARPGVEIRRPKPCARTSQL
jgi:hypothetical protein